MGVGLTRRGRAGGGHRVLSGDIGARVSRGCGGAADVAGVALLGESASAAVVTPTLLAVLELTEGGGGSDGGGGAGLSSARRGGSAVREMGLVAAITLHRWKKQIRREDRER